MRTTVLVIEDELMISLLYEEILAESEDFELKGIAICSKTALASIERDPPDMAIVDYVLSDGPCLPVIRMLYELEIPFVIASGRAEPPLAELKGVPWITKPFPDIRLLTALRKLVRHIPEAAES